MLKFAGAVAVVIAEIVILFYDMTLVNTIPGWVLVYIAVSFLVYQTMDTLDGIHARNHCMSSTLGQLFDAPLHGFLQMQHLEILKAGTSMLGFTYIAALIVLY
jgi:hypothetical protein